MEHKLLTKPDGEKSMRKAGIITIMGNANYGNRLQNYAVEQALIQAGFLPTTIRNVAAPKPRNASFIQRLRERGLLHQFKTLHSIIRKRISNRLYADVMKQRENNFKAFSQSNLNLSDFEISNARLDSFQHQLEQFDFFVVGSDQVWNPHYRFCSPIDFLTFAPPEKRIAYSASFGIDTLPPETLDRYRQWLDAFCSISVREQAGADIVHALTGKEATVLIDPTMMLQPSDWDKVAKEPQGMSGEKYILSYFLSGETKQKRSYLEELQKHTKHRLVRLLDFKDQAAYPAGPSEFIHYIKHAEFVVTDSFHGAVFSIIYHKPFVVFGRGSHTVDIGSRIDTLLLMFGLSNRKASKLGYKPADLAIDYQHTDEVLERERARALSFLKEAAAHSQQE